jgi:hypothetical protein
MVRAARRIYARVHADRPDRPDPIQVPAAPVGAGDGCSPGSSGRASTDEVFDQLNMTPATAQYVLKAARQKLDARPSAQAVAIALTVGAIDTPIPEP